MLPRRAAAQTHPSLQCSCLLVCQNIPSPSGKQPAHLRLAAARQRGRGPPGGSSPRAPVPFAATARESWGRRRASGSSAQVGRGRGQRCAAHGTPRCRKRRVEGPSRARVARVAWHGLRRAPVRPAPHLAEVVVEQAVAVGEDKVELVCLLGHLQVHPVVVDACRGGEGTRPGREGAAR